MVSLYLQVVVWVAAFTLSISSVAPPQSLKLKVVNHAGSPIEIFWIDITNPTNLVKQSEGQLLNKTEAQINTYQNHTFIVRFAKYVEGSQVQFTKGPHSEVVYIKYNSTTAALQAESRSPHEQVFAKIESSKQNCSQYTNRTLFMNCMAEGISSPLKSLTKSHSTLAKFRDAIAHRLRNYTCADPTQETSTPVSTYSFPFAGKDYEVKVLLDMPHAKVWVVEDFLQPHECEILEREGRPNLHRATVAAEDGTSVVSEHRKAQQASYHGHQDPHTGHKDPLWMLQQRILALTNQHAGYNLDVPGQEGFTIIQYNPSDEYTPHCDGSCDHSAHTPRGRVASAVMYCTVPTAGGATTFTRANLFVKPTPFAATFFAYKGSDGLMDQGYTEHSGCPVLAGEKLITTFWMREGVDAVENWMKYDPSGLKILTENE